MQSKLAENDGQSPARVYGTDSDGRYEWSGGVLPLRTAELHTRQPDIVDAASRPFESGPYSKQICSVTLFMGLVELLQTPAPMAT